MWTRRAGPAPSRCSTGPARTRRSSTSCSSVRRVVRSLAEWPASRLTGKRARWRAPGQAAGTPAAEPVQRLARQSGGWRSCSTSVDDVNATFTPLMQELHYQYVLGFTPQHADGKLHDLRVTVSRPGLTVRAQKDLSGRRRASGADPQPGSSTRDDRLSFLAPRLIAREPFETRGEPFAPCRDSRSAGSRRRSGRGCVGLLAQDDGREDGRQHPVGHRGCLHARRRPGADSRRGAVRAEALRVAARVGPEHGPLLVATCSSFTQYGYAFLETEADILGEAHHDEAKALRERALKLYLRGRGYCLRAMDVRFQGHRRETAGGSGAGAGQGRRRRTCRCSTGRRPPGARPSRSASTSPISSIDFPTVRALADRALALDETWSKGALHELMISLDSLPEALGGNASARARALQARGRAPERPVAGPVRRAGDRRRRAGAGPRGVRAAAQAGAGDRSGEGPVEPPRDAHHPAARAALLDQIDEQFSK